MTSDQGTRDAQPIILIRGFGGLGVEDEKRIAYQGFNDGTVYPQKRGENYIYEGMVLRFLKSQWDYQDATNVIGYYGSDVLRPSEIPAELGGLDPDFFGGGEGAASPGRHKVVIDPGMALQLVTSERDIRRSLWVFRYYDLDDRQFAIYGRALVRLIEFIRALAAIKHQPPPRVNIIAHSMGGLIAREAIQVAYPEGEAPDHINKVVTLGTPHRGISFQLIEDLWLKLQAEEEIEHFNPESQADMDNPAGFRKLGERFPLERFLCVIGTNYRTYSALPSLANRMFSVPGEYGPAYNRSDGLVKQAYAWIPGAPRTFVHKCHGGRDSLVTSREAYEIARRFFFGNVRARLSLVDAEVSRGKDLFGKSEFFLGVSIKPRRVDFDLFHQSAEAEDCYGPFRSVEFNDEELAFGWAGEDRLIWEGYLDSNQIASGHDDLVMRLDIYVGERDVFGIGFSDNVIFRQQFFVRAVLGDPLVLQLHRNEDFNRSPEMEGEPMDPVAGGWQFEVGGPNRGFTGTFRVDLEILEEN